MHFETRAIHEGQQPDPATGAITTPIYQTSTYVQDAVGVHKGYDYARVANPTRTALQECIASLEGAAHGRAFSSGLGAVTTLMHLVSPGDHVVAVNDVYGGIYRMFTQVYEPKGYRFTFLSPEQISTELAEHLDERTKFVWLETPTNPALNIVDIAAASEIAHGVGATRRRRQHLRDAVPPAAARARRGRGAALDDEVHRRPLGRHRRLRRGERRRDGRAARVPAEVAGRDSRAVRRLARAARREDARGADGPSLRERRDRRIVPGATPRASSASSTPACPRTRATRSRPARCATSAAMVSFLLEDEREAVDLVARTKIWKLAESLGGVESMIEHPARMTHASTADSPFAVPPTLIRLSVGIESVDDLVDDLETALAA